MATGLSPFRTVAAATRGAAALLGLTSPAERWVSGLADSPIDAVRRATAHRRGHRRVRQVLARWTQAAGAPVRREVDLPPLCSRRSGRWCGAPPRPRWRRRLSSSSWAWVASLAEQVTSTTSRWWLDSVTSMAVTMPPAVAMEMATAVATAPTNAWSGAVYSRRVIEQRWSGGGRASGGLVAAGRR